MIFVSYNHKDANLVSAFVGRLASRVGRPSVFYDEWSIEPGDGIIDRMNWGLENTKYFVFLLSQNSLTSKMVALEWQNALLRSAKGLCRFIPVRLDQVQMPAVIAQQKYIDLYGKGIGYAVDQLVATISGAQRPENEAEYDNIVCDARRSEAGIELAFFALTYFEPICQFSILLRNEKSEFLVRGKNIPGWTYRELGHQQLDESTLYFVVCIGSMMGGLTPGSPFRVMVVPQKGASLKLDYVMHKRTEADYKTIPLRWVE